MWPRQTAPFGRLARSPKTILGLWSSCLGVPRSTRASLIHERCAEKDSPEDMDDIVALLKKVFAMGRLSVPQFVKECPEMEDIQDMKWFKVDLPDGAPGMKDTYVAKTHERRQSKAYRDLQELLNSAVAPDVTHLATKMEAASLHDSPVRT